MAARSSPSSAPATSANLGPGFDMPGPRARSGQRGPVTRRPGPLEVRVRGEGAGELAEDGRTWSAGRWPPGLGSLDGLLVECRNRIPLGSGLGLVVGRRLRRPGGGERPGRPALDARRPAGPGRRARGPRRQRRRLPHRRASWPWAPDPRRGRCRSRPTSPSSWSSPSAAPPPTRPPRPARHGQPRRRGGRRWRTRSAWRWPWCEGRLDDLPPLLADRLHEPHRAAAGAGPRGHARPGRRRGLPGGDDLRLGPERAVVVPRRRHGAGRGRGHRGARGRGGGRPSAALARRARRACAPAGPGDPHRGWPARWGERSSLGPRGRRARLLPRAAGGDRQRHAGLLHRRGRPLRHRAGRAPRRAPGRAGRRRGGGGRASRCGSPRPRPVEVEIERVVPVIEPWWREVGVPVAIDTFKAPVAGRPSRPARASSTTPPACATRDAPRGRRREAWGWC